MPKPIILLDRLAELARAERKLRLLWGVARWLAVVLGVLVGCCALDWLIDLWYDTPGTIRILMSLGQLCLAIGLFYAWIVRPLQMGLTQDELALWVESRDPFYHHRLISSVQLNDSARQHFGMSEELISAVTAITEEDAREQRFTQLLDPRRRNRSLVLILGTILLFLLVAVLTLRVFGPLIARQFLNDNRIPRQLSLDSQTADLWPSGEPVTLKFLASGSWSSGQHGSVQVIPDGQSAESYPLTYLEEGPSYGQAIFSATVPASSTPFSYRAWLFDGRTHQINRVRFAPRPVLASWEAWLQLPDYLGTRPDGKAYELPQPKGDLQPVPGSTARIQVVTQTPIVQAAAELLGPLAPDLGANIAIPAGPVSLAFLLGAQRQIGWTPTSAGPLFTLQKAPLTLDQDCRTGSLQVNLPPQASAYRIVVRDEHGFTNRPIPRRAITFKPDETPRVTLLPERFTIPREGPVDLDLEGMPVPLGRPLRIAYVARDDLALESARLRYRINEGEWQLMNLSDTKLPGAQASFDVQSGAFTTSNPQDQVPFHATPPSDDRTQLGRQVGGGRFDFQTRALPHLKVGDVFEYFVEVSDRHAETDRQPGRSIIRRKTVVTEAQFVEWVVQVLQQENRLRQLERQQRRVFEPARP